MVDFVQLQQIMKESLEQDRVIRTIDVTGSTLEKAVSEAAVLLNLPIRRLEYEVIDRGFPGILGKGQKDWKIRAYERVLAKKEPDQSVEEEAEVIDEVPIITDKDGDAFVHLYPEGAFLKVVPPIGKGKKVTEALVMEILKSRMVKDIDIPLLSDTIKEAAGVFVKIGNFESNPLNDAYLNVEVSDMGMKAYINVTPAGPGGCDLPAETILSFLRNNHIIYGVKEDFIRNFADRPIYKENVLVAEGIKPSSGRDAFIQHNFETDQTKVRLREGFNGQVDFKDLHIIQNVVEGQPLAKKIPPELGSPGMTVNGKVLPAVNGRDMTMPLGKNVHVGDDDLTIYADINGQVVEVNNKINVEPIYTVKGNVDIKTGNIIFLGTVVVTGNVEAGFSVKAAGNIEVHGTVEKAELDAEGDIIVHQGITGKGAGIVRTGRSLWARFIENTSVEAGNMVVVSDGIINSQVDAYRRIACQGKRAHIVGGRLRATDEIIAETLGSPTSGTETVCEVGFDPKHKEKLGIFTENKESLVKQLEEIRLNLQTLINIKKQRKSLPEDKERFMRELMDKRKELMGDLRKINEDIGEVQEILSGIKKRGRISASSKVYPGVKIIIRDVKEEVRNEYKAVTFILENGLIRVIKYEESEEKISRGDDGYPAD
ncbi:FapA family protein [Treponema sp. TIM-1]|uniref:FapA family protein n=1 Tax=Treponema sp. TIM-1 TaxID=2898417 RepID=UPI00397FB7D9